jgi:hypothetical protein
LWFLLLLPAYGVGGTSWNQQASWKQDPRPEEIFFFILPSDRLC